MKNLAKLVLAGVVAMPALQLVAQDKAPKPPEHFYHLVFRIEETDGAGKVINSRSYTGDAVTEDGRMWEIKTGTKVPVPFGNGSKEDDQFQYVEVGVNIGFQQAMEDGPKIHLMVNASVSSLATGPDTPVYFGRAAAHPIIRQNSWNAEVLIPVGKPTVIFSSDNLENKGKTQVELIATRIE